MDFDAVALQAINLVFRIIHPIHSRKLREAWRLVFASVCRQKVTVSHCSLTPIDRIPTIGTD